MFTGVIRDIREKQDKNENHSDRKYHFFPCRRKNDLKWQSNKLVWWLKLKSLFTNDLWKR